MEIVRKSVEFFFKKKWLGILVVIGLVYGVGISTFYRGAISPKQRTDLTVFLKASEMIATGRAGHIYGIENIRKWHYNYPPMLAILLAPVSQWPLGTTVALAYFFSIACLVGIVVFSRKLPASIQTGMPKSIPSPPGGKGKDEGTLGFPHPTLSQEGEGKIGLPPAPWQIALALFFCLPMFLNTLTRGQLGIITLFFMAAVFYSYLKHHKVLTGLLLAFAVTLKISPLAFLVFFFLMKREWKILLSTAAGFGLFFFLLPSLVIGFDQNWKLLEIWRGLMTASQSNLAYQHYLWGELFTPFTEDNQSIYAVVTRLAWHSQEQFIGHSNAVIRFATTGFGILLLALPFIRTQRTGAPAAQDPLKLLAEFSLFPMLMLFTSPVTQIHHYTIVYFLFLAALMLMDYFPKKTWTRRGLVFSLWICAVSLTLGMAITVVGEWGVPLWGSMLLWGMVLYAVRSQKT